MINICFWNINKKKNKKILENLILENNIDILILIEDINNYSKIGNLKKAEFINPEKDIKFYHNNKLYLSCSNDQEKYKGYKVNYKNNTFYLFGVHLPSKLHSSERTRNLVISALKTDLKDKEKYIICGDFNSNPFDETLISADSFSALPCTSKRKRTICGIKCENLYNPMWKFFDDFEKIPGTYYYDSSDAINYYWNTFDQVLLSYNIIKLFNNESLKIIKKVCDRSLIKNNKIDKTISDHLPVLFSIKEDI